MTCHNITECAERRACQGNRCQDMDDAKRYLWLRSNMVGVINLLGRSGIGLSNMTGENLDAAIDAERSKA